MVTAKEAHMLETVLYIPFWFELTATIVYAVSGAMSASRAQYDLLGTITMATIVGLFGGIMRDVLLQDYGIYAFQRPELMVACIVCGVVVFYFGRLTMYLDPVTEAVDTIGVGLWTVVGAGKALSAGLGIVPSVIMSLLTAVGGGIVRDVLMNKPIAVFQPGSYYGSAVAIGATVFGLMHSNHVMDQWSGVICVILVIGIRLGSVVFGWRTRPSRDLTVPMADALAKPVRALKGRDLLAELHGERNESKEDAAEADGEPKAYAERSFNKRPHSRNATGTRHRNRQ
jgi:uncharacterized membrane protein YeiH